MPIVSGEKYPVCPSLFSEAGNLPLMGCTKSRQVVVNVAEDTGWQAESQKTDAREGKKGLSRRISNKMRRKKVAPSARPLEERTSKAVVNQRLLVLRQHRGGRSV